MFYNLEISKLVLKKSDLIKSLNDSTCDSIFQYAEFNNDNFVNYSLKEKQLFLVDAYLTFIVKSEYDLDYVTLLYPSNDFISELVNCLEEVIEEALSEI